MYYAIFLSFYPNKATNLAYDISTTILILKIMKNYSVRCSNCIIVYLFVLITSCSNREGEFVNSPVKSKDIAMEVCVHSTVIDKTEPLRAGLHDEFLHPDVVSMLENDPFLRKRLRTLNDDNNDTIFTYDEIPLVRESKIHTCIYKDGTMQTETDFMTPFSSNTLFQLNENPPSEKTRISKTIEKNGLLKMYNYEGKLLSEEVLPVSDMSNFLDTMKLYVRKLEEEEQKLERNKINPVAAIRNRLPQGSRILRHPNGHVLLEIDLVEPIRETSFLSQKGDLLKSKTELSEDMTKTLKFELFRGDYLVQRKVYTYNDKDALRNLHHKDILNENPESIESECLMLNSKGLPVLHHSKEFFYRNQTCYYFED